MRQSFVEMSPGVFQPALRDDVDWIHQPAFDKAFADLTGTEPDNSEWRRETNWNFTADDQSYTQ